MSETTPDNKERNPFTRPGFVLSAALVIALVAAVIVIAFLPDNDGPEAATPSTSASASAPATTEGGTESVCGLPSSEQTALGSAPESDWDLVGRTAVPSAPETVGPGVVNDDGIRSCFAHSPSGALFAAANIFGLVSSGEQETVLEQLSADSAARDKELQQLEEDSPSALRAQIKGFQVQNYTESTATIDLGIELENGAVGSVPIPLVWEEGDWKLNVTEGGLTGSQQLIDLGAYIPWSGV